MASSNVLALYMPRTGESFSWAISSEGSTLVTSPMRILVFSGTSTPAIWAMVWALWPTILALTEPLMMTVLRTLSSSAPLRK